jgi:Acyl-CoA dehydrogenase, N-terminal domain
MELARVGSSIATFWGVHTGLSAGSIYLCGDETQKQRWLPPMMRWEKIGSFGLTEPLVGSATSGGMLTTCRKDGDGWALNGQKKWIGTSTFSEINVRLGAGRSFRTGQRLRRREGQPRFFRREDQDQDGVASRPERPDYSERLPRERGGSPAEGQHLQGLRQSPADDADRRRVVRGGLRDGRARACASLRSRAQAIR